MNPEETKRLILAFAIMIVVLALWRPIVSRYFKEPEPESTPAASSSGTGQNSANQPAGAGSAPSTSSAQSKPAPALPAQPVEGKQAEDIVVENDLYKITFSTQGAVIKSWILKKYRDADEKPLDLVNQPAGSQLGLPMAITLPDTVLASKLNGALYVAGPSGGAPPNHESIHAPAKLRLTYSDGQTEIDKVFTFPSSDTYQVDVEVSARNAENYLPVGVLWPGGFGDSSSSLAMAQREAVYAANGDVTKVKESKLKATESVPGPISYAGLEDLYFVNIFLPGSPDALFRISRHSWNPPNSTAKTPPAPLQAELAMPSGQPLEFGLFVAPKDLDLLKSMNPPLDNLVEFGFFGVVAKPLFIGLRYIYDHWVHNYGWAIIVLTVVINFLLFPLKLKSIHSAQKMQKVAPIVKRIQDQYKQYKINDPRKQKMNQEIMKVYSEHGINPLGGCLPMALQMPFLYAFWEVLGTVIELRHAPWIGCVKDLSVADACHPFGLPFALMPTLLIISMFVMQKMTPMATADPNQQRMMYIMPLMFGVIFYRLASGVVLYYMAANVVGIVQQLIINRFIPITTPATAAPPDAKGPAKGSGKAASRKPAVVKN
ncbi:MAG TPA: membrane protein insertase YidC [Terriglobia bacterium]|nr:membrane protein insertase YidC [Terriglobia bacterium]